MEPEANLWDNSFEVGVEGFQEGSKDRNGNKEWQQGVGKLRMIDLRGYVYDHRNGLPGESAMLYWAAKHLLHFLDDPYYRGVAPARRAA